MLTDAFTDIPDAVLARAAKVKLAAFDVDGTLTDGSLWFGADGHSLKRFHVHDGYGLKQLQATGIEVAIISARISHAVSVRCTELGIHHVYQDQQDKAACLGKLLDALHIQAEQCAFMGDDGPDAPALRMAGLAVATANARPCIADCVHWRTPHRGGEGAVRDLCDLILAARDRAASESESQP